MARRPSRRLAVVLAVVVVVAAVAAGAGWWLLGRGPTSPLADAVRSLPASSLRLGYTDWARVSKELDAPRGKDAEDPDRLTAFLGRAYDADVTSTSALVDSFDGLAANYGVTPADAQWEAYGQSRQGAVDVLKLDDGVDLDRLADKLRQAGYDEPDDRDGVWTGSAELVVGLDVPLTDTQQNVAILHDQRMLLMGDDPTYLEQAAKVAEGGSSVMDVAGVTGLVEAAGTPESAQLWVKDFACEDLAMSKADQVDQREADRLVEKAGGVHPLDGLVMTRGPGRQARIGMWFADEQQAQDDLQPRTDLARGAAPGQGGTFGDRFRVVKAFQDGQLVELDLRVRDASSLLTDLGQGGVLFATC